MTLNSSMTVLASSFSAISRPWPARRRPAGARQFQLEALALADVDDAVEAQARQCALHRLALGVEDLRLEHDVDHDAGHGHSHLCLQRLAAAHGRGLSCCWR